MQHRQYRFFMLPVLLLSLATSASTPAPADSAASMVVRYYNRGDQDAHHAYKYELIEKALKATRQEYGDYQIEPYRLHPGGKRQPILLSEGKLLNLIWASPGTHHTQGDVIAIPFDISRGLLGYRVCLTTGKTKAFDKINQLEDLRSLRIGQVKDWADTKIYQNNGIQPVMATSYESLFDMLSFERFDCLALGANEVLLAYRQKKSAYENLTVDSKLLIAYEYPLYFYVSKKFVRLAERIKSGLEKLKATGEFDTLFNKHFANDLKALALHQRKIICLTSPYLDQSQLTCPEVKALLKKP
jgi:ABC-type amino acid transport substrate-binding protein